MRALSSAGVLIAAASVPATGRAAAWTYTGSAALSVAQDDNILFAFSTPLADQIARAELSASLARVNDRSNWLIAPRIVAEAYAGNQTYNHVEQYLTAAQTQRGERGTSNLSFSFITDTTLTSELGLTGLSSTNKRRQSRNLSWSPSMQATEKWMYGAQLGATAVRYADAAHTSLVDYNYGSATVHSSYLISQLSKLTLQLSAGRLQVPENASYDNSNYAATIAYNRVLGEKWQFSLSGGPSQIRAAAATAADRGQVYDVTLTRQLERNSLNLLLSRDVTPNGLGLLAGHEQAALSLQSSLSERLSVNVSGVWSRTRNVLPSGGLQLNRLDYSNFNATLNWAWAPNWRLTADLWHARQQYDNALGAAQRWHGSLGISWSGLERALH